jgi:hypothetical protein
MADRDCIPSRRRQPEAGLTYLVSSGTGVAQWLLRECLPGIAMPTHGANPLEPPFRPTNCPWKSMYMSIGSGSP